MNKWEKVAGIASIGLLVFITWLVAESNYKKEQDLVEMPVIVSDETEIESHAISVEMISEDKENIPSQDRKNPESDIPLERSDAFVKLTQVEMEMLEGIAMAEAEGEDVKGKALVMRVVLNRSLRYGQSIEDVIFTPQQFCTGRMDITPDEECHEALALVIDGWDESEGALYFSNAGFSKYGEPLFQHGNHYFSGEVSHER